MNKKLTASYINGILKCLRAFFHFAVQEEYIYANPTDKVRMQNEDYFLYGFRLGARMILDIIGDYEGQFCSPGEAG